jgi:Gpi18-like mannosyltransferase
VPDQPEAYQRVAGQRPYFEPAPGSTAAGGPPAQSRLPQRDRREPGLPGWLAVLLLIAIAGVGGLIDSVSGTTLRGVFGYSLVFASLVAILTVRRSRMFDVVIAPPLVYFAASAGLLYVRTGGLHNRGKLIDAATNWIVYGFPAIAGATAVVLVVAGIRLMSRR